MESIENKISEYKFYIKKIQDIIFSGKCDDKTYNALVKEYDLYKTKLSALCKLYKLYEIKRNGEDYGTVIE